ncbi:MerR family transcriptional regulator [Vagococcus coleopterorum]|uniref:MerR family transcriptional regulator n=1 Tax=Vagococcus coleopterorum TaxID=2714946 RepID=A0A6G8AN13_9ENTE|nr:MerR family transcriptional regulator [Vagococcus coleopterorum]QIL46315.1 MerR family transcriptional regulator [Vagococcus coleopterorum]
MTLTIKELADLAGISNKTLRYYDQINLLKPSYYTEAGYRIYEQAEIDRLHKILLYKTFDMPLEKIAALLDQEDNQLELLKSHQSLLLAKQTQLINLIANIEQTIKTIEGESTMTNTEKFAAFKTSIDENEALYGEELRQSYGSDVINQSVHAMKNMTTEQYNTWLALETTLLAHLQKHAETAIPSPEAELLFNTHKEWLHMSWGSYDRKRHAGLAELYLINPEFTEYYDSRCGDGSTTVLVDIIRYYTSH